MLSLLLKYMYEIFFVIKIYVKSLSSRFTLLNFSPQKKFVVLIMIKIFVVLILIIFMIAVINKIIESLLNNLNNVFIKIKIEY